MPALDAQLSNQRKLDSLLRLSQLLSKSPRLSDVLNNAMKGLEECLGARDSSVYEVDYERGELFFRLARGEKATEIKTKRINIGEGVAGWVARTGRPKVVDNTAGESTFYDGIDRETGYQTQNMLTLPLISKGVVIGVAQLLNKEGGEAFTAADLELAQIMAGQIAMALENARLYEQLEQKQIRTETELARTQDRLIRSERKAALSGLAQGIAHQIRNPSMSIGGFARRILEKVSTDNLQLKKYAQVILDENRKLEELVRQVVFLINIDPKSVMTDLNGVIRRARETAEWDWSGIDVETKFAENLPLAWLDPHLMERALHEVWKNSMEAGATRLDIVSGARGEELYIQSSDNGHGLSEADLTAALDPFYSSRAQNLGLGLAIAARIMEEHGGRLTIGNHSPKGAIAHLGLPLLGR